MALIVSTWLNRTPFFIRIPANTLIMIIRLSINWVLIFLYRVVYKLIVTVNPMFHPFPSVSTSPTTHTNWFYSTVIYNICIKQGHVFNFLFFFVSSALLLACLVFFFIFLSSYFLFYCAQFSHLFTTTYNLTLFNVIIFVPILFNRILSDLVASCNIWTTVFIKIIRRMAWARKRGYSTWQSREWPFTTDKLWNFFIISFPSPFWCVCFLTVC